jgi:hypothetical protein
MSIVVNLPADVEKSLAAEAASVGMTISDFVARRLLQATTAISHQTSTRRLTGAALVQRWRELGLIGYRPDITDPEAHARRIRDIAQRRSHSSGRVSSSREDHP